MTPTEEVRWLWSMAAHETNYRTVASRANYACFNRCLRYAVERGLDLTYTGDDHGKVAAFLRVSRFHPKAANLLYRIGAGRLPGLKRLRSKADYGIDSPFLRAAAQDAVSLMEEITEYMDEVEAHIS